MALRRRTDAILHRLLLLGAVSVVALCLLAKGSGMKPGHRPGTTQPRRLGSPPRVSAPYSASKPAPGSHCHQQLRWDSIAPRRTVVCRGKGFGASSSSSQESKKKTRKNKQSTIERFLSGVDLPSSFKFTGEVRPGKLSPPRPVKKGIQLPEYARSGQPSTAGTAPWDKIEVKSAADIEKMKASGRIAREILDAAGRMVKPGVTTDEIDELVHRMCMERDCYPSPLNYQGFPKSVCTSVNEVICHGIPDTTVLKEGDIINIDVTIFHDGFHGDCSETFPVGEIDDESKKLIQVTYNAWQEAIKYCKPGAKYNRIGGIIERYVTKRGYKTSRDFVAHGIGKRFHTKPFILHYENNDNLGTMEPGHVFTIEPMICKGTDKYVLWPDKWTAATKDGERSAQFEHTFLVTQNGVEALTGKTSSSPVQFWEDPATAIKV